MILLWRTQRIDITCSMIKKIQLKIKKGNWYFGGKLKLKKDGVWKWI